MISRINLRSTTSAGVLAAALVASPSFAQTNTSQAGVQPAEAVDSQPVDQNVIVVTGSLISNPNLERSAPVNVTTAEEIEFRNTNVAEELLSELPGVVPSIGSAVNNGNGGASFVNLRGLGSNRNVVLLDGVRIVPTDLLGRFDLNNVPVSLVERVDVLTGGASTTYGADAIGGVVNFITKKDFAGFEVVASNQITERGDGNIVRVDVSVGANFDDGRGNAVLAIGYQQADPIYQGARNVSLFSLSSLNAGPGGSTTTVPSRFNLPGASNQQIDPTTGALVPLYETFNFNPFNIFQTPFERYNIYGQANYEITPAIEVYTRGLFSKNFVQTIIAPSGIFGSTVTMNANNPFIPQAALNRFCATSDFNPNVTGVQTLTPTECAAARAATGPSDPNYRTFTTTLGRRTVEVGPRLGSYTTNMFDYRLGFRGALTDTINWDVFGAYGESERVLTQDNYVLTSRVRQALLANNTTTCITATNGCVPLNVFGPSGSISDAQAAFIRGTSTTARNVQLAQARAVVDGDFGFVSPLGAVDPIGFAVGGEYRKYTATQQADFLAQQPGELGGAGGAAPNIRGGYDVYEAFGELIIPLVQDTPFFEDLTIDAGIRYSSYSVDAPNNPSYNTTTYKAGASWTPVEGVTLRGNYSRAVRAPNISELFTPVTTGLTNLATDPCQGAAPVNNANLRAVCLAQGAPNFSIGNIPAPISGQVNATGGGNLNLLPETATSYTLGVVLTPRQVLPGFNLTLDYYNIKVKDAITNPTPGDIISGCFDAPSTSNPACNLVRRDPVSGSISGDPSIVPGLLLNLTNQGTLETSGFDLIANYRTDLGFADLALSFAGNYTIDSLFQASPTSINRECTGFYSVNCGSLQPKLSWSTRATLSFAEGIDFSVLWRHIDSMEQEPIDLPRAFKGTLPNPSAAPGYGPQVDFSKIPSYDYFDLTTRFEVTENFALTVVVQNLFDKDPPLVGNDIGSTTFNSGNTFPATYDAVGRRYGVTARLRF